MNKRCSGCKQSKDVSEFTKNSHAKDGLNWYCRDCVRDRHKGYKRQIYKQVFEKYNNKCAICGSKENLQVHHIVNRGQEDINQLTLLCKKCHFSEGHPNGRWNTKHAYHRCLRCNHEWPSKQAHPTICPKCKTPYWDKEKR